MTRSVAIVGAGCAGTLTAVSLLRHAAGPSRVVLIERSGTFGPGVAYSTHDEQHRLNVVAERMSAFDDEPDHLTAWAKRTIGSEGAAGYLPRAHYGAYLRDVLDEADRAAPGRLERITGEVVDVAPTAAGTTVVLADGRRLEVGHVVLALGSLTGPPPVPVPDDPRVIVDPWAPGALAGMPSDGTSLLIGSGLTGVDVALSLCHESARGRVIAVSRGGRLPFDQIPGLREPAPPPELPEAPTTVEELEGWLRRHVRQMGEEGHDWREVVDGVRSRVPRLWQSLPLEEQRRFVREGARAWELRRHRMAPETAVQVRRLLDAGRLVVRAGRVVEVRVGEAGVDVLVAPTIAAAPDELRTLHTDRVVVCGGPGTDVRRSSSPLLRGLLARGVVSADALALGVRATSDGAIRTADGRTQPRLHVLGPLRRGELWETTAVPEIRAQARTVARAVATELAERATVAADLV